MVRRQFNFVQAASTKSLVGGEARRSDEFILVRSCQMGGCAPSHPILMGNSTSPLILPARLLLLASNGLTEEPEPPASTPVGSQDRNLHSPGALHFPLNTPPSQDAGKPPAISKQEEQ